MNPNVILNQLLSNAQINSNPILNNAVNMYRNNDINGLKQLCENVCRERGLDINQISSQIISQFK